MTILLPEETNDRSFAMTSSVTCMMYAGLATFCPSETTANRLARIASGLESVISGEAAAMQALAARSHERVVYLGSHVFKGLAREAALKLTELTDGIGIAIPDSPMGFRHGPKTVVNSHTLIVIFVSNNAYSRRYDLDLIHELVRDGRSGGVMTICADDAGIPEAVQRVVVPDMASAPDVDLLFPFIAAPQIFACEASLARGLSPDRPNTAGTVHRVVQGVRIHPLH